MLSTELTTDPLTNPGSDATDPACPDTEAMHAITLGVYGVSHSCSFFQVMCSGVSALRWLLLTAEEDFRVGLTQGFVLLRKISLSFLWGVAGRGLLPCHFWNSKLLGGLELRESSSFMLLSSLSSPQLEKSSRWINSLLLSQLSISPYETEQVQLILACFVRGRRAEGEEDSVIYTGRLTTLFLVLSKAFILLMACAPPPWFPPPPRSTDHS